MQHHSDLTLIFPAVIIPVFNQSLLNVFNNPDQSSVRQQTSGFCAGFDISGLDRLSLGETLHICREFQFDVLLLLYHSSSVSFSHRSLPAVPTYV